MKKILTTAALAVAFSASAAYAGTVNLGGVEVEVKSGQLTTSNIFENIVSVPGDVLGGFGKIAVGLDAIVSICGGCELTFEFGDYVLSTISAPDGDGKVDLSFTGGWVKVYLDHSADFDDSDITTANDGTLWLSMIGHSLALTDGSGRSGTLFSDDIESFPATPSGANGFGWLDVIGGLAMANFDTDGEAGGSDLFLDSNFGFDSSRSTDPYPISGSANLEGTVLPEPGALGLLGLGLVGFGLMARRRRS